MLAALAMVASLAAERWALDGYMDTLDQTDRRTRIVLVTTALSLTGGLVGALCGGAALSVIVIASGGASVLTSDGPPRLLSVAAAFGACCGMVGGPLLGWGLLRRVPLGRAILWTAVGATAGALSGELLRAIGLMPPAVSGVLAGALLGFVGAGVVLRIRGGARSESVEAAV
jgi:hypothetical protein